MPLMLTTIERRVALLKQYGADSVVVLEFNYDLSQQTADEFVEKTLVERLNAVRIVVGANFRFGHRASGDVALLRKFGLEVDDVPLLATGEVLSSTQIRALVADGRGRRGRRGARPAPPGRGAGGPRRRPGPRARLSDRQRRGRRRASRSRRTGSTPATSCAASGDRSKAAISVGTNPTFDGETRRVEAYVIDEGHELELYDEHVMVEFAERLRGMERFDTVDELVAQMAAGRRRQRVLGYTERCSNSSAPAV